MSAASPEFDPREIELFQQRLDLPPETEGLLDRIVDRARSVANSRTLIEQILKHPAAQATPRIGDLRRWHRYIFGPPTFPEIGRFRTEQDPAVGFATPVLDEANDKLVLVPVAVSTPGEILGRLADAFERFHDSAAKARGEVPASARAVARLQTDVITVHPFVDGNSRTTNVLQQAALHFLEKPRFIWGPKDWKLAVAAPTLCGRTSASLSSR